MAFEGAGTTGGCACGAASAVSYGAGAEEGTGAGEGGVGFAIGVCRVGEPQCNIDTVSTAAIKTLLFGKGVFVCNLFNEMDRFAAKVTCISPCPFFPVCTIA